MKLTKDVIQKMMRSIQMTHANEITCGECFDEIDRFAELELAGKNAVEAMPLVQQHLDMCKNCQEEYEALLKALSKLTN